MAPATESGESRDERRSQTLSADALAALNHENTKRRKRRESRDPERDAERAAERAERRRARREQQYRDAPRERPRRAEREEDREAVYEKPRRDHKSRKRRVVSGAVMEEGRSRGHLRGGGWSSSNNSLEKEYLMDDPHSP
ncbi:betaglucosidase 6 [Colletotrichum higginsianum]|nr:betaglucosidase 6 [Colletotrichum higginsianum]